ncbi:HNH endonuclease [Pseudomonas sp. UMC65]|uniref:HNH endonuclease n=1 Tax=Pseudomonas sp. UMC65 TaxID=1862323 RepID=UPI0016012165|nr:HNH endonuclease signature motif containing protein [Pseudomonas sp. UMC65]
MKLCKRCGTHKALNEFHKSAANKDGLYHRCRECCSELKRAKYASDPLAARAKRRADYLKNRERILASNFASRAKHHEAVLASKKVYYERVKLDPLWQAKQKAIRVKTRGVKSAYDKDYRAARPEQNARNAIAWVIRNPEKRKTISKAYKARRRTQEANGDSTAAIHAWEMAAEKACYWCKDPCEEKYHVDHYEPLARGGRHVIANLVISCPGCNLKKNAKDPYAFAATFGRLF